MIGIRNDEGLRILKGMESAEKHGRKVSYPLARAKIVKADIMGFWSQQAFDLGLEPWEGNCDLCFLKGRGIRKAIIRGNPASAAWWVEQERLTGGFFDRRDRYVALVEEVKSSPQLFDSFDPEEYDVECGLQCSG